MKSPTWQTKAGQNPKGGLNAKGRASYNAETGGNLKAPVKSGDNPRRASFLARMGNMAELPSGNTTTRKVYSATELPIGIIYVSNSMLELTDTTKRLTILEFYNVVKNNVVVQDKQVEVVPHTPLLSEEIKRMILDSSFVPADIYK